MDLTIYVQSGGLSAAFALSLDVLPHQLTAVAHVTSILQMCSTYAESRPSQKEAHQQLKSYMDKVNLIQTQLVNKQKRRTSAKRGVKPMPVILDSKGDYEQSGNEHSSDEESTVRPIAQQRQKARTAPAAESDPPDEDVRPDRDQRPDPSPRGSSTNSNSLEDIPSELMYGSGRQATDDVNWEKKPADHKAETMDVTQDVNPASPPKSGAHLLSTSFRWRVPSAPVSWIWSKKSARIVPEDKNHSLDQAAALMPRALLE